MLTTATVVCFLVTGLLFGLFMLSVARGRHLEPKRYFLRDAVGLLALCAIIAGAGFVSAVTVDAIERGSATTLRHVETEWGVLAVCGLLYWLILVLGGLLWRRTSWSAKWFAPYSALTGLLPIAAVVLPNFLPSREPIEQPDRRFALEDQMDPQRVPGLRKLYPFESIEDRLPPPPAISRGEKHLSVAAAKQLQEFENDISGEIRTDLLKVLHEGSVEDFIRREGFGVGRRLMPQGEHILANGRAYEKPVPQPGTVLSASWQEVEINKEPKPFDLTSLFTMHRQSAAQFVNPSGFGYMKKPSAVAGFDAHRFSRVVETDPWKVHRLDLVGLLMADKPRVYLTDDLPRMENIRKVPTRELDAFESAGLAKLHAGEDLFIRDVPEGIRMLGAIRSAKQCLKCHGGERGDLLGAFSYSLQRTQEPEK